MPTIARRFVSHILPSLAVATALLAPALASADTLYNQPFAETEAGGYFASTQGSYLQYDSFVLTQNATIQSVSWFGVDLNELLGASPLNPDSFTITLHADAAGLPGAALSFSLIGNRGNAVDTGTDLLGLSLFRYSATLTTPFQASAGTRYWIGISDPTTSGGWFWASGSGADGNHVGVIGGEPGTFVDDMSFTLDGTVTAVPEPTSGLMMLVGAAGVLLRRRRA